MKKTVFISSTYEDLIAHRRAVWQVLKDFDVNIRGMEEFGARPECPLQTCLAEVEQSDVYLGIIAFKLGSIDASSEKSFTQLEYEHAVKLNKIILIYLADEQQAIVRAKDFDIDQSFREKLKAFKNLLQERHTVNKFSTAEDLAENLRRDFKRYFDPSGSEIKPQMSEFDRTKDLVKTFLLIPKSVSGREALFKISQFFEPYPAARSLCQAFKLDYGMTIGTYISVALPKLNKKSIPFNRLYATGTRVTLLLDLISKKEPVDLYARLQFTEQDIKRDEGQFFGETTYYSDDDQSDPNEIYVPPEGKSILLFSKVA
jgi:hypothetical protein